MSNQKSLINPQEATIVVDLETKDLVLQVVREILGQINSILT